MPGPLLGLMALAGGALGQDWYWTRRGDEEQARARGILGTRPEQLAGDVAGPPNPGTGLLGRLAADPGDPGLQLDFQAGLMGMPRRERAVANQLFGEILGRASQARENVIGRQFQAGENKLARAQAQQHWEGTEARIGNQFERTLEHNKEQFAFEREKFGDEFAFRQKQHRDQQALGWASEARQANTAALNNASTRLDILAKERGLLAGPEVKLPTGYQAVRIPTTGAPGDPGQVVAVPIRGTPEWNKAQGEVDQIELARANIRDFQKALEPGRERFGAGVGTQKQLWSRVMASIGKLDELGTLQPGDLERLKEELPDPTGLNPFGFARLKETLTGLDVNFERRAQQAGRKYLGWSLDMAQKPKEEEKGQAAPPPGSKPVVGGSERYVGRGSKPR